MFSNGTDYIIEYKFQDSLTTGHLYCVEVRWFFSAFIQIKTFSKSANYISPSSFHLSHFCYHPHVLFDKGVGLCLSLSSSLVSSHLSFTLLVFFMWKWCASKVVNHCQNFDKCWHVKFTLLYCMCVVLWCAWDIFMWVAESRKLNKVK